MTHVSIKKRIFLITFGLFLGLVSLELFLRFSGGVFLSIQEYQNTQRIKQKHQCRILCLGDSTTAPITPIDENAYPGQLEKFLNENNQMSVKFAVINKGVRGASSETILSMLEYNLKKYKPDVVVVMMGVNDTPETCAYTDSLKEKIHLFLTNFRTYKLAKLLRLHLLDKIYRNRFENERDDSLSREILRSPLINRREVGQETNHDDENLSELEKELAINPREELYFYSGLKCYKQGHYDKAVQILEQARLIYSPRDPYFYILLGSVYQKMRGTNIKAEEAFKKAVQVDPRCVHARLKLGLWHQYQGNLDKAKEVFRLIIKDDPTFWETYQCLGQLYMEEKELDKAIEALQKSLAFIGGEQEDSESEHRKSLYADLGLCYLNLGRYEEARSIYNKIRGLENREFDLNGALGLSYFLQGKAGVANKYFDKSSVAHLKYYKRMTMYNYQKLKKIVLGRKIILMCVQYPMRDAEALKKMLSPLEGAVIIDNESVFRNALRRFDYDELFSDQFGGDFGHCTTQGNKLLAENIGEYILKFLSKNRIGREE